MKGENLKKYIIIGILSLLIGCGIGYLLGVVHYGFVIAPSMLMLQEKEIAERGESVYKAYLNEPTDVGIWALKDYIDTLNRIMEERRSYTKFKNPYFILSPEEDLVLAHGRLALLYKKINKIEKSKYHFGQAISHSKNTKHPIETEQELINFLEKVDKK